MKNEILQLIRYQKLMSWVLLEYNVCYFIDGDFAGKYKPIHKSWYVHRRINDSIYDHRWLLFKDLSLFLGEDFVNEVGFDPSRPSAKLVMDKLQKEANNIIEWPNDVEELFYKVITSEIKA